MIHEHRFTHLMKCLPVLLTLVNVLFLNTTVGAINIQSIREFWFSGAEINHYALNQTRYGHQHPGHVEFIFVTEPFLTGPQVKNETGGKPSTDVLKLNALRTFNTGIYSYRTMTSTFKPIDLERFPHALKTTTSVQDWCGQSFQQINWKDAGWKIKLCSYFEKEGDQNYRVEKSWLEDELWLLIRLDPSKLPIGSTTVIPGAVTTRFAHRPIQSHRAIGKLEYNSDQSIYTLTYPELQTSLKITFDSDFPHIIRAWEETSPQGTTQAVLKDRIINSEYWLKNTPSDRNLRKQLGLDPLAD